MKQVTTLGQFASASSNLEEAMTYGQLFKMSDPLRIWRSGTVRGPPLEIHGKNNTAVHTFNFKAYPSTTGLRHRGYIKFQRPTNGKPMPAENMPVEVDCECFGPETLVLMSDGIYKPISEIRPGDYVYTHKGRVRPVIGNVARELRPDENVYSLSVTGFPSPVIVTESHPFYALRGNRTCFCGCGTPLEPSISRINLKNLNPEQILSRKFVKGHCQHHRIPNEVVEQVETAKRAGKPYSVICRLFSWISKGSISNVIAGRLKPRHYTSPDSAFDWVKVGKFRKQEWFLSPWLSEGNGGSLSPHLARFLGYYAAEGHLPDRDDVKFSFHTEELNTLGADIIRITESLPTFFRKPQKWSKKQGGVYRVYRYDSEGLKRPQKCFSIDCHITPNFKSFISTHVGIGSWNKRLSPWFMNLCNATLQEFLTGLFLGDGTFNKIGRFRWTSRSKILVWNVSTILRRLRIDHILTNVGHGHLSVDINQPDSARQVFDWLKPYLRDKTLLRRSNGRNGIKYSCDEGSLKAIRKISPIDYTGQVWDLCVEEDHSFIVAGVAVANCPDYKYRWAWANRQKGAGRIGPQSLNQAINRAPRITNPSGKPALCKHLLAARNYIYGLIQKFPKKGEPAHNEKETEQDVDWKLDQLVKHAQKRWSDYPAQQQAALKRQQLHRAQQQVLNVRGPGRNADQPQGIDMNAPVPLPPEIPAPPAPKKKTPTPPPIPTVKPGKQAQPGPKQSVKKQQPQAPKARGNKNKNQQESLVVITANSSNHMNTDALLKKTKSLVEELEDDMQGLADEAPPTEPGANVPPAEIAGGEVDPMGGPESPEDEALELLRTISAGIDRMANELAPVEAESEDELGDEELGDEHGEDDEGEEAAVPPVEDDDEFTETMPVATGA